MQNYLSFLARVSFVLIFTAGVNSFAVAWSYANPPGTYGDIEFTTNGTLAAGTYTFNNLTINSGVTVTISGNTSTTNGSGVVIFAASVNHLGTINGNGRGFGSLAGPGAGEATSSGSGAGHGGLGAWSTSGSSLGKPGSNYGTSIEPTALGSGGGRGTTLGGSGGGAIKIVATGSINIGGSITVNATNGSSAWDGGGSGGSIWIEGDTITGTGALESKGGVGGGAGAGGGAGGRIYLAYKTSKTHSGTIDVSAGSGGAGAQPGSGIVVKTTAPTSLTIPVNSTLSNGTYTFNDVTIPSGVTASVTGLGYAGGEGPGAGGASANGSGAGHGGAGAGTLAGAVYGSFLFPTTMGSGGGSDRDAAASGGGVLRFVVAGTMTVSGTLASNGGAASTDSWAGAGSGGSIWIDVGTWAGGASGAITANGGPFGGAANGAGGGRIYIEYTAKTYTGTAPVATKSGSAVNGTVVLKDRTAGSMDCGSQTLTISSSELGAVSALSVTAACSLIVNGDLFPTSVSVSGSGAKLTVNGNLLVTGPITIASSGALVMGSNTLMGVGYVVSAASVSIASGTSLNADSKGYNNGQGAGAGGAGNAAGGGGGYGGNGGAGNNGAGGTAYGSPINPNRIGSSSGNSTTGPAIDQIGSAGGGAIILVVPGTIQNNGTISANGAAGTSYVGGGSGGSVWITAGTVSGSGYIRANGGATTAPRGGGGGGRIYISANTWSFTTANVTVTGGAGQNAGAAGTFPGVVTSTTATTLDFAATLPTTVRKYAIIDPQPIVLGKDASGNVDRNFAATVTLSAFSDAACTSPSTGILTNSNSDSPLQFSPINGVALFAGVFHDTTETIYVQGSAGSLKTACTLLNVGAGIASQLVFTTQPAASTVAGNVLATQPVIEARDVDGVIDTLASISTITVYSDSNCTTYVGTITGTGSNSSGVTTFTNVRRDTAGTYYLKATSTTSGVTAVGCSAAFVIVPNSPYRLAYSTAPSGTVVAGVNFPVQPVVVVQDNYNNTIPNWSGDITLGAFTNSVCSSAATGTLTGQGPYSTTTGVVATSGVSYTKSGTLRLGASATGLIGVCSNSITVNPGAVASLAWFVFPPATADVGANFAVVIPSVTAADAYANAITLTSGTFTLEAFTDASCTVPGVGADLNITSSGFTSGRWRISTATYAKAGTFYFKVTTGSVSTACTTGTLFGNRIVPYFFRNY